MPRGAVVVGVADRRACRHSAVHGHDKTTGGELYAMAIARRVARTAAWCRTCTLALARDVSYRPRHAGIVGNSDPRLTELGLLTPRTVEEAETKSGV